LVKTMSESLVAHLLDELAAALYVATQTTARMFECLRSSFMASDTSAVFRCTPPQDLRRVAAVPPHRARDALEARVAEAVLLREHRDVGRLMRFTRRGA